MEVVFGVVSVFAGCCWRGWPHFGAGAANKTSLGELNNLNIYNLADKTLSYYGKDTDSNPYLNIDINSTFHDPSSFIATFKSITSPIFLSLNIRSLQCNFLSLSTFVNDLLKANIPVVAIALQEIWQLPVPETVNLPGFNFISKQRNTSRGGGVGFYIAKSYNYKIINGLSIFNEKTFESLTITIQPDNTRKGKSKLLLSNIYRSPTPPDNITQSVHLDNFYRQLDELLHNINVLQSNSHIFLDANINLLNIERNQQAIDYLQTIHTNSFIQIIGKATRIAGNSYSLIDHIITNSLSKIRSGVIITDISDHFVTFTTINTTVPKTANSTRKSRDFSTLNINNFKGYLYRTNWQDVLSSNNVNQAYDNFSEKLLTGIDLFFPLKSTKFNRNYHKINDFMTKGLLISRITKSNLHKAALLSKDPVAYIKFKQYRNLYNTCLRLSKKLYYEQGFKKFKSNPKKTWELLNEITCRQSNKSTISETTVQNETISDPKQIANTFNNYFTKIGSEIADAVPFIETNPVDYLNPPDDNILFDIGFTSPTHIIDIIKSLPPKSSADLTSISTNLLKAIAYQICTPLAHIFTLSLDQGVFPEKLKTCRTVPIFKAGDPHNIDNYRPISLVSTISKVLEKMVATKLTNYLQINKLISPWQFGFQKNLSTEHNLIHITNYIGKALNNGEFCIGIFFDLKKAFDVVQHNILLAKLEKFGIKDSALSWFRSYLANRKQVIDINNTLSEEKNITCSVLQGSILGPILFLCFINDFPLSTVLKIFMFADDTTCLIAGKNLNDLITLANHEIQKMALWYRANKMMVNTSKTKFIIFHNKGKKIENVSNLIYNSNEHGKNDPNLIGQISRISSLNVNKEDKYYKLLGVYFDEHLNFNQHIEYTCSKLSKALFFLRRAKNFISAKALTSLYFALFHSHLLYCTNILSCANLTNLNRITILQKKAIRLIANANFLDHTEPLFKSLNILPFHKLLIEAKLNFMHKIYYGNAHHSFINVWKKNSERQLSSQLRNNDDFFIPHVNIELFRRIPLYSFAKSWNELGDIKFQRNPFTFKQELKSKLRENSSLSTLTEA